MAAELAERISEPTGATERTAEQTTKPTEPIAEQTTKPTERAAERAGRPSQIRSGRVPSRVPARSAPRDGDRRRQIEAAAGTLFRERGYVGTSVRQIAQALDLQGASLYSHVASKEDVLWSIVERTADRFAAAQADVAGPGPAADRLRVLIAAHVAIVTAEREHAAVFLHEWRFLGPQRRDEMLRRRDAYERTVRDLIAQGIAEGSLRPMDPRLAAAALLSALNGVAAWYRPDGPDDPVTIGQAYADLFLTGLATAHLPDLATPDHRPDLATPDHRPDLATPDHPPELRPSSPTYQRRNAR